jgi:alpha-D-xyloside xylohydrolase
MRPLVMDFPDAGAATAVDDQYMFGPALMVSPVTSYKVRERAVTFPATPGGWYDFWTGAAMPAGGARSPAPFDAIPIHVRAGSIIPFGPDLQYTDEKPADPITLFVYAGRDGAFTLYEDDGVSNGYEKGVYATIPIRWNDAARALTVGKREGGFPGMLSHRTFAFVLVSAARAVPFSFAPRPDKVVSYTGDAVTVKL